GAAALRAHGTRRGETAGCGDRAGKTVEHAAFHQSAESLAPGDGGEPSAAAGEGPKAQAALRHPDQGAAADLRPFLQPADRDAGLLSALSGEWPARQLQAAGHSDPRRPEAQRKSLCRPPAHRCPILILSPSKDEAALSSASWFDRVTMRNQRLRASPRQP